MALESYLKELVGTKSEVRIIFDNSSSELPFYDFTDAEGASSAHIDDSNSMTQELPLRSRSNSVNRSLSQQEYCPATPVQRLANDSRLDDFRERRRLIKLSMSPGVSPKSPRSRRRHPSPPQGQIGEWLDDSPSSASQNTVSDSLKKRADRFNLHF